MTKDLLMKYTFIALVIIAVTSVPAFGISALFIILISLAVAVICDYLMSAASKRFPRDIPSSAVAGMIVALSFSSGIPALPEATPNFMMNPTYQYAFVAGISAIAVIVFKKIQGLLGRKYVNPVAVAKLLALAPIMFTALIPVDHLVNIATGQGLKLAVEDITKGSCYTAQTPVTYGNITYTWNAPFPSPLMTLTIFKNHGWLGGASSIAVIAIGIALILLSRGYIKWKIPLTYLMTIAVISGSYGFINGEDVILRLAFHLFVGSVIFLAFFMATDPATTPLTGLGQIIFAIGLGVLTLVFQLGANFLGGSILALVIMNLTTPILDKIGIPKLNETERARNVQVDTELCVYCKGCDYACPHGTISVNKIFEGSLTVDTEKCPENCQVCIDICPTNAIVVSGEGKVKVSEELCIHCKACQNVCPKEAIHVTIDRILHSPITSATWITVLERCASYQATTKELAAKSKRKLRQTVEGRAHNT